MKFQIQIDDHRCRPIDANDWRAALNTALERVYPGCWSPSLYSRIYNGHGYVDIYRPERGAGTWSSLVASHVEIWIREARTR